jgi:hypothetical protein
MVFATPLFLILGWFATKQLPYVKNTTMQSDLHIFLHVTNTAVYITHFVEKESVYGGNGATFARGVIGVHSGVPFHTGGSYMAKAARLSGSSAHSAAVCPFY